MKRNRNCGHKNCHCHRVKLQKLLTATETDSVVTWALQGWQLQWVKVHTARCMATTTQHIAMVSTSMPNASPTDSYIHIHGVIKRSATVAIAILEVYYGKAMLRLKLSDARKLLRVKTYWRQNTWSANNRGTIIFRLPHCFEFAISIPPTWRHGFTLYTTRMYLQPSVIATECNEFHGNEVVIIDAAAVVRAVPFALLPAATRAHSGHVHNSK